MKMEELEYCTTEELPDRIIMRFWDIRGYEVIRLIYSTQEHQWYIITTNGWEVMSVYNSQLRKLLKIAKLLQL